MLLFNLVDTLVIMSSFVMILFGFRIDSNQEKSVEYEKCDFVNYQNGCQYNYDFECRQNYCVCKKEFTFQPKTKSCVPDCGSDGQWNQSEKNCQNVSDAKFKRKERGARGEGRWGPSNVTKSNKKPKPGSEQESSTSTNIFVVFDIIIVVLVLLAIVRYLINRNANNYDHLNESH